MLSEEPTYDNPWLYNGDIFESCAHWRQATVLSTGSRTPKVDVNILGESISGKNEA